MKLSPDYAKASVVNALVMSFSKICLNDSSVSDDDLYEALITSLCNMLGEEEFQTWLDGIRTYRNMREEQCDAAQIGTCDKLHVDGQKLNNMETCPCCNGTGVVPKP